MILVSHVFEREKCQISKKEKIRGNLFLVISFLQDLLFGKRHDMHCTTFKFLGHSNPEYPCGYKKSNINHYGKLWDLVFTVHYNLILY